MAFLFLKSARFSFGLDSRVAGWIIIAMLKTPLEISGIG